MAELREFPLITKAGVPGSVFRTARFLDRAQQNLVRLSDGREFEVPSSSLEVQPDGSFLLDDGEPASGPAGSGEATAAAPAPEPPDARRPSPADDPVLNETLFTEDVSVERISVNRIVDAPPAVRADGETTIVPVVEEVITYQKRLMLKEEIRITRRRTPVREPRRVLLDGTEQQA